jgi:hypothetical protein
VKSGDTLFGYLHPNDLSASFHKSLINLVGWDMAHDHRLSGWASVKCASGGIPEGRNKLCEQFLESGVDWLFMVDADMGFEPVALDQLLSVAHPEERPIVGGLAFAQREAAEDGMAGYRCIPRATIFDWLEHEDGHYRFTGRAHYPANTLVRCAATGGAFLVIHRSVIQKIRDSVGERWFDRIRGTDGALMGEDISFFARTQALGIPCYVHTGIRTTHQKNLWLGETDFWHSFIPPAANEEFDVYLTDEDEPADEWATTLKATTGWCGDIFDNPMLSSRLGQAPWILITQSDARFRPSWFDHALDNARRYDRPVIGLNDCYTPAIKRGEDARSVLVSRAWLEEHDLMSVSDIVKTAQKNNQFLASLASEVVQVPKK